MATRKPHLVPTNIKAEDLLMDIRGGGRDSRYYCLPPMHFKTPVSGGGGRGYPFHLVTQGHEVGVFDNWLEAKASLSGYPDSSNHGYDSIEECIDAWQGLCRLDRFFDDPILREPILHDDDHGLNEHGLVVEAAAPGDRGQHTTGEHTVSAPKSPQKGAVDTVRKIGGESARKRERQGLPPAKPGKTGWVHGTKLPFFEGFKQEYLAAAELNQTGAFYKRVAVAYLAVYGYHTAFNKDLEEGQTVADDVDPDEDVDSLDPEEATFRAEYFKLLRTKIGAWFNGHYGGSVEGKQKNVNFKTLFNKPELAPPAPIKPRLTDYYSRLFYAERVRPRFIARWAAITRGLSSGEKPPAPVTVRNKVTREAWDAETTAFREEVALAVEKEHQVALEAYSTAVSGDTPTTAAEYNVALNNAAYYLQPFVDAASLHFGMNVSLLMCGPIPDRGGAIEIRSVHSGMSNGMVPRIWTDFDRAGFDVVQRSFVDFTHHCFTEEQCRARSLNGMAAMEDVPAPTVDIPMEGGTSSAGVQGHTSQTSAFGGDGMRDDILTDEELESVLLGVHLAASSQKPLGSTFDQCIDFEGNGTRMDTSIATTFAPPVLTIGAALAAEVVLMTPMARARYLAEMEGMAPEVLEFENDLANSRAEAIRPRPKPAWRGAQRDVPLERPEVNKEAEGPLMEEEAANAANTALEEGPEVNKDPERPVVEEEEAANAAKAALDAERAANAAKAALDERPEVNKDAERPVVVEEAAKERGSTAGGGDADEVDRNETWDEQDRSSWPKELKLAVEAFARGRTWGGEVWESCVKHLLALEGAWKFPTKGLLLAPNNTAVRPKEVGVFMGNARKWGTVVKLLSDPGPRATEGTFGARWWGWWDEAQPAVRKKRNGKFVAAAKVATKEWEDVAKMAGRNGLLLYVGALLWWGEAAVGAGEDLEEWKEAARDVAEVLEKAREWVVGPKGKKRSAVVATAKKAAGGNAKRKSETGPDKENEEEPAKKRRRTRGTS
ncbi:hypothetical protein C8R46DRAFT_1231087 [Mycena filopes]|nr:hypothetical protein C8R46DRAFT_1231087 [Mycena filopes]